MKKYVLLISMHADPAMPPGYDEWGGTHTYMKELLDMFEEKKIYCIFITRRSMEQLPYKEQYNPYCQIIRLTNGDNLPMSKQNLRFYHEENLQQIIDIIKEKDSLPLIIHSVYWNSGRLALEISQKIGIPYVHSVISNARGRISRGAIEPIEQRVQYEQDIYDHAEKILCVSEDEKQDLIQYYHITPFKIIVCGQYISPAFWAPAHDSNGFPKMNAHLSDENQSEIASQYNNALQRATAGENFWLYKAFTYFGRMDINKGIPQIMEAWYSLYKQYRECCPPLWLAGGSLSEIEDIRKKISSIIPDLCKLEKNCKIFWWGYLTTEGLSTILLKSLVLIAHSLYEPGGRVVIEAMSEGIPVIATPNGFAKDSIHNWENGFLVDYNDVHALSQRMEHFIRQPLLSNSLGLSAKEWAKKSIYNWNFINEHLKAYGIDVEELSDCAVSVRNYYRHKLIDIYPYYATTLSDMYIKKVFSSFCSEKSILIRDIDTGICTSDIKELTTETSIYIVKHVVQRLATSPFYNPLSKEILARDSQLHYNIEVNLYERLHSPIFVGKDSFHRLLFLRKLAPVPPTEVNYLIKCIDYLYFRPNILTSQEKQLFIKHILFDGQRLDDIQKQLLLLQQACPNFYFECSGMFCNQLSWKIAPHLIAYNCNVLSAETQKQLEGLCMYFGSTPYKIDFETVRDINLDIEMRHIMTDGKHIYLIDHEKTSMGIIESDIAALLYNYYCNSNYLNILDFWESLKDVWNKYPFKTDDLLSAIAYRIFYDIIVDRVLEMRTSFQRIQDLNLLKEIMEEHHHECNVTGTTSGR